MCAPGYVWAASRTEPPPRRERTLERIRREVVAPDVDRNPEAGGPGGLERGGGGAMKVVVSELNPCKRGLEVEVPGEEVSVEIERTFREYSRRVRVPGFRQGRIPMEIVRRKFGKEVQDEVVGKMVREYAMRALEE